MSKESVAQFWKKVETDARLQRALDGLFEPSGKRMVASSAAVVDLAAKNGFKFTADELKIHLAAPREVELSDAALDTVAGGIKVEIEGIWEQDPATALKAGRAPRLISF